ncbi:MAG: winged helix-turn-helix transcriptional regulator [Verrucomicrobia bacterium]|nr:winged helix-turn-helix transcriptional regulator [Verrucomicrobiota bacterium]
MQVARLYYDEELSQQEIADQLGVSRSLIAQYLQRARAAGIVRIRIVEPDSACSGLETALVEATGVSRISVVSTPHGSPELALRAVATAAAGFLSDELHDGDTLGLGWGRTLSLVVDLTKPAHAHGVDVLPLMCESGHTGMHSQMNELIMRAADHLHATPHFLSLPMVVSTPKLRNALVQEAGIREVIDRWNKVDVAAVGIGVVPPVPGMIVYIGEEHLPRLIDAGAVGDICGIYYDRQGAIIENGLEDRIIAANVDQLRSVDNLAAVACGSDKAIAVLGALRTGLISSLFIDQALAEQMLAAVKRPG